VSKRQELSTISSNRTIVGLKRCTVTATFSMISSSNRTIVGLKPSQMTNLRSLPSGSNRTIVGLKQVQEKKQESTEKAAIAPLWD